MARDMVLKGRSTMRVRVLRSEDIPEVVALEQQAAITDQRPVPGDDFINWLNEILQVAQPDAFVITDDDDELQTWGQAGTLEGVEGELAGYTVVQLHHDQEGYHLVSQGAVHPSFRRQRGGRLLLVSAMNRARVLAAEFDFEAELQGIPVYFEAWLPIHDPGAARLADKCEMKRVHDQVRNGLALYRREL